MTSRGAEIVGVCSLGNESGMKEPLLVVLCFIPGVGWSCSYPPESGLLPGIGPILNMGSPAPIIIVMTSCHKPGLCLVSLFTHSEASRDICTCTD